MTTANDFSSYVPRLVDRILPELVSGLPAISLVGPRGGRQDHDRLGAVKRAVDDDPRAGQFLLTGCVRATFEQTWPATARVARVPVFGLTVREQYQRTSGELFLDRLPRDSVDLLAPAPEQADLATYLELSLRGGFPDAVLHRDGRARRTWLTSYHAELLASDVAMTGGTPDPRKLATYVEALAAHSAGVVEGRHEVDLVVEYPAGMVAGVEIKATAAPSSSDARHLAWLRDQLDDRFIAGVVLHTGPHTFRLGDRIIAAPISTLWAG